MTILANKEGDLPPIAGDFDIFSLLKLFSRNSCVLSCVSLFWLTMLTKFVLVNYAD